MNLIGMMPCRNEDWVLNLSARAALMWCDSLCILDHASWDRTPDILEELRMEYPGRVHSFAIGDPDWREMDHRQALLSFARSFGPTHLAIIDADEVLTSNLLSTIRGHVQSMPPYRILQIPGYNLRGGLDSYHINGIWGDRMFSLAFADDPRLGWRGNGFHQRQPDGAPLGWAQPIRQGQGGIMHLWGASERRLVAKHHLYKMTETLLWPAKSRAGIDQMYTMAFDPAANKQFDQNWRYAAVPSEWWDAYRGWRDLVDLNGVPWQEEQCKAFHAEHGAERFAGLNLEMAVTR
jgi:hypothetical protein